MPGWDIWEKWGKWERTGAHLPPDPIAIQEEGSIVQEEGAIIEEEG